MNRIALAALVVVFAACGMPPTEPPKEQLLSSAQTFYGAFNTGNAQQMTDLLAPDFTDFMITPRPDDGGKGNLLFSVTAFKQGYPDLDIVITRSWQEGDTLTVFTKVTGTNTGPLFGAPATGKAVSFSTIDVLGFEKGKLKDLHHIEQQYQMFQQLK